MNSAPNGSRGIHSDGGKPNLYALVVYVPDPLGSFLDNLRREMTPDCNPHAHVSVLPPRQVHDVAAAIAESREAVAQCLPFELELSGIEVFPTTDVIYINLAGGSEQLRRLHERLNRGALAFAEPFVYHPHVTLAQQLDPSRLEPMLQLAAQRWRDFPGPRVFRAERTVFVQNAGGDCWIDLAVEPFEIGQERFP